MIVATGLACRQLGRLDVNADPISQLDDLLLFVCIPSFFLYGIFSAVPAIAYSNYMALFGIVLQVGYIRTRFTTHTLLHDVTSYIRLLLSKY